jgi:prevent-host-death family protein
MCYDVYMKTRTTAADATVGVRELRQNLSIYLERVSAGEVLRVTDRGRAVALLVPLPAAATTVERLIASGRATAPQTDLLGLGPPTVRSRKSITDALKEIRDDRL